VVALRVGEPFGSLVLAVALTVVASVLTVVPGQATRLQGGVHLVALAAFLFLAINP
jgi:Ca2+:H+ antiporter